MVIVKKVIDNVFELAIRTFLFRLRILARFGIILFCESHKNGGKIPIWRTCKDAFLTIMTPPPGPYPPPPSKKTFSFFIGQQMRGRGKVKSIFQLRTFPEDVRTNHNTWSAIFSSFSLAEFLPEPNLTNVQIPKIIGF